MPSNAAGDKAAAAAGQDRFRRSRRLVWACVAASIGLAVFAIWRSTPEAAQIATVTIPSLIGAALGFAGVSNWAEVRRP